LNCADIGAQIPNDIKDGLTANIRALILKIKERNNGIITK